MALTKVQDKVLHGAILANLKKNQVFANLCNTDYEGEVKFAGTVRIIDIDSISMGEYTVGQKLDAPGDLTDSELTLTIDKMFYFNKKIDKVTQASTKINLETALGEKAAISIGEKIDTIVSGFYVDADEANVVGGTTPVALTKDNVYENFVGLAQILDENDTPEDSRWAAIAPKVYSLLLQDSRFTGKADNSAVVEKGLVGSVAGLKIYKTNALKTAGAVVAGYPGAVSLATQISEVESYDHPDYFATCVKGLVCFGYKTVRPKNLAVLKYTVA